jgi:hypothetical protein
MNLPVELQEAALQTHLPYQIVHILRAESRLTPAAVGTECDYFGPGKGIARDSLLHRRPDWFHHDRYALIPLDPNVRVAINIARGENQAHPSDGCRPA